MPTKPLFFTPDGDLVETITRTTSIPDLTLTGEISSSVVDVQVKINDGQFVSDPSLIFFDLESFTVPNPQVFPEGLSLNFGTNVIQVRSIDVTGAVSDPITATVTLVRESDLEVRSPAPTGLRVRRRSNAVELVWTLSDDPNVIGYHVYASTQGGGGDQGYVRINQTMITEASFQETEVTPLSNTSVSYQSGSGQLRILMVEEDFNEVPLQEVAEQVIDPGPLGSDTVRVTTSLENIETIPYVSFVHNRSATENDGVINNDRFALVPDDDPLFYVITSVAFDVSTNQEIESNHSAELIGLPLIISTDLQDIPGRNRNEIVRDYLASMLRSDAEVSAIPGSVVRDIFIEPFASEAERLHFIAGFIRRSQSFSTLLPIDDLDQDGVSDPVSDNPYKRALKAALGFERDADVQALIDDSFEKLASNVQVIREGQDFAVGQVTFYTNQEPSTDLVVREGTLVATESDGPSVSFEVTSRVTLSFENRQSFYNLQKRRWEITANIQAVEPGEDSNVSVGQITRVLGSSTPLQVENLVATQFGRDRESNTRLAERAILAFSSVDSGTESGYLATALRQRGVFRAKIVKSESPFMMRDYDPVREKHIGGKVDVWVQGRDALTVVDTFALRFQVARNIRFTLDSTPANLIFLADDPRLTPDNPITELLGATALEIAQGFGFRNLTTGQTFDLTGYSILGFNRIQLNTTIPQPAVGVNDIIAGDYRFQASSQYIFSSQPVLSINSVQSVNTGTVFEEGVNFDLIRSQDPLLTGFSTKAQDVLEFRQVGGIPSGDTFPVNDERHVLIGETPDPLLNLGVSPITVRVFTLDRLTEYNGPDDPNPDFLVLEGDDVTPTSIVRVPSGNIGNGEEVSVDYSHDENFQANYTTNNLLTRVQSAIESHRHVTADVLVKQTVPSPVDLEMTVVIQRSASQAQVDAKLRTVISQFLNSKPVGQPVYQSDIIQLVESIGGVIYVVVPLTKMALSDGTLIIREFIASNSVLLDEVGNLKTYLLIDPLNHNTADNGGTGSQHRGVFLNDQIMDLREDYASLLTGPRRSLIVGRSGLILPGFSDDPTLIAEGYLTASERDERRKALTANRVIISMVDGEAPDMFGFTVSYNVFGDRGAKDILVSDVSALELGQLTITYQQQ